MILACAVRPFHTRLFVHRICVPGGPLEQRTEAGREEEEVGYDLGGEERRIEGLGRKEERKDGKKSRRVGG